MADLQFQLITNGSFTTQLTKEQFVLMPIIKGLFV